MLAEDAAPSRALGAGETVQPDPELTARHAAGTAEDPARIVSTDLSTRAAPPRSDRRGRGRRPGVGEWAYWRRPPCTLNLD